MTEWARLRKYARRMRVLREIVTPESPSPEFFLAIRLRTINKPLFPNLKTLCLRGIEGTFIPFVPLFLSPGTTSIDLSFESGLPETMVAPVITTLPTLCPGLTSDCSSKPPEKSNGYHRRFRNAPPHQSKHSP